MSEPNKAVVRGWLQENFNERRLDPLGDFSEETYAWRGPGGVTVNEPAGMREMCES